MRQEKSQGTVHEGRAEVQCCAELYGFYSRSQDFQTELRLYVCGFMSQRKSQKAIAHLQCISISFEDSRRRNVLCKSKHKYIIE